MSPSRLVQRPRFQRRSPDHRGSRALLSAAAVGALRALGDQDTSRVLLEAGDWSLVTDGGENPLAPGATHAEHLRFLFFCAAVLKAVDTHHDVLARETGPLALNLGHRLERVFGTIACGGRGPFALPEAPFALEGIDAAPARTVMNRIVAEALREMTRSVRAWRAAGDDIESAALEVIADSYRRHRRIAFAQCDSSAPSFA